MSIEFDGLLDTSAVIDLGSPQAVALPDYPGISAVTLAELSIGPHVARTEDERATRQQRLQWVEANFSPIPFDAGAARAFGRVAADLRNSGRKPAARAYDALIAATALANGLPLYTANPRDFVGIGALTVVSTRSPHQEAES